MPKGLSQKDLAAALAQHCGLSQACADALLRATLAELGGALARGEGAELRGLGTFICRPPHPSRAKAAGQDGPPAQVGGTVLFKPGRRIRACLAVLATRGGPLPRAD